MTILNKKFIGRLRPVLPFLYIATLLELTFIWWSYHPIDSFAEATKKPQILENIDLEAEKQYRFLTIDSDGYWNKVFQHSGWKNQEQYYNFFYNSIEPNMGIFYGLNQLNSYQILNSRRQDLQQQLIASNTKIDKTITLNNTAKNILSFSSVKYLVTTREINDSDFDKINEASKDSYKFFLYRFNKAMPIFSIYYNTKNVQKLEDYPKFLNEEKSPVLVENIDSNLSPGGQNALKIVQNKNGYVKLNVQTSEPGLLVYSDSYYPGWQSKVNGFQTKIHAANVNSKAILIPKGESVVEFRYASLYVSVGIILTIISHVIALLIILRNSKFKFLKLFK